MGGRARARRARSLDRIVELMGHDLLATAFVGDVDFLALASSPGSRLN
jgi:hypothetical protein